MTVPAMGRLQMNHEEIRKFHEKIIDLLKRNRVFREGTIGEYVVVGIDGVELFSNMKKSCPDCLSRKKRIGETAGGTPKEETRPFCRCGCGGCIIYECTFY